MVDSELKKELQEIEKRINCNQTVNTNKIADRLKNIKLCTSIR